MSLLRVNKAVGSAPMRRVLWMMLGYMLMLLVAIPTGVLWLMHEMLHKAAQVADWAQTGLENCLEAICEWDKENRQ